MMNTLVKIWYIVSQTWADPTVPKPGHMFRFLAGGAAYFNEKMMNTLVNNWLDL
jgi:hypothetical protein